MSLLAGLSLSVAIASPEAKALEAGRVIAIQTVLTTVRDALIGVQKTLRHDNYPPLSVVTLTLQTTVAKQAGGEVKLWVVVLGGKAEKQELQEIVIQLTPPSPNNPRNVVEESLTSALESAIVSPVEGAQNAGSPRLPLTFTGLQVSISFVVKSSGGGGAKIEILPISADLSGEISESSIQNKKVVFGALK
jgi:Trypsin-co-occurring domain 2